MARNKKLTVTIDFVGALLRDSDFPEYEAARLLRNAAQLIEKYGVSSPPEEWGLLDLNGNTVGRVVLK